MSANGSWRMLAVGVAVLFSCASAAYAGYTPVSSGGGSSHESILEHVYGGDFVGSGEALSANVFTVFSNGTVTARRVKDFGESGNLCLLTGDETTSDDDEWTDGIAVAEAQARFAGYSQEFGFDDGNGYVKLFDITGSNYNATGGTLAEFDLGAIWQWARANDSDGGSPSNLHYSWAGDNADGVDHLVTYHITGIPGLPTTTNCWMLFWEDLNGGGDHDYNDLVIELRVVDCIVDADCDDDDPCTVNSCSDGVCYYTDAPAGTTCELDGNLCTLDECDGAGGCAYVDDVACADPTSPCDGGQTCNPGTGLCEEEPDLPAGSACDTDSDLCTLEACDGTGACLYNDDVECAGPTGFCDGGRACDPGTGSCVDLPDEPAGTGCDLDGDLCTLEVCSGTGVCVADMASPGVYLGGARLRSFANTGGNEMYMGRNMGAGGYPNRVEQGYTWIRPGSHDVVFTYDVVSDELRLTVDASPMLVYPNASQKFGEGSCTLDTLNIFQIVVADRDTNSQVDFLNVMLDGESIGDFVGTDGYAYYEIPSDALTDGFTFTGTIVLDGLFSNSQELSRVEMLVGCAPANVVECQDPIPPCEAGEACNPATGLCETLTDATAGTGCEQDGNLCTIEECNGSGACVFAEDITCPGPTGFCDGGTACNPATGSCEALADTPAGTACDRDSSLCTIDQCDGNGACAYVDDVPCMGPSGPCDGGQTCDPVTGDCVDLPDTPAGTACDSDGTLCTVETCDGTGDCVYQDEVDCPAPTTCDGGAICDPITGACVDQPDAPAGTSCDRDGNPCTIDACDGSGACVFVEDVTCQDPTTCDGGQACNTTTGLCEDLPDPVAGTSCDRDGNACSVDQCDGAGACVFVDVIHCADPTTCDGGSVCDPVTGACVAEPDAPAGTTCDRDSNACTVDACDGTGSCVFVENIACQDPTTCDGGQVCNPTSGACEDLPDPAAGTSCDLDSNACTVDICDGSGSCVFDENVVCADPTVCDGGSTCDPSTGACVADPDAPAGTSCDRDSNACTIDVCDGSGSCVFDENVACADPTTCDGGSTCDPSSGTCVDDPDAPAGTSCDLDGNACTVDVCDGSGACVFDDNVVCADPTVCDGGSTCDPATGACVADPDAPAGTACDRDSNACTIDECDGSGSCVHADDVACLDPTACDGGSTCDPTTGICVDDPDAPAGTSCDLDSNACTVDICDGSGSCVFDENVVCADPTVCDGGSTCDPATGACVDDPDAPSGTDCDRDNDLCTIDECDGSGSCVPVDTVFCAGSTGPCDSGQNCDPTSGSCVDIADPPWGTACDLDGNACTVDECNGMGGCIHVDDIACADATTCDGGSTCDPASGACVDDPDAPAGTSCDRDGNLCTTDVCDGSGSCVFDEDVTCPEATVCDGGQVCDPATGVCEDLPDPPAGTSCDLDGNACTVDECDGTGNCVYVEDVTCAAATTCDGGATCDPATGACIDDPDAPAGTSCNRDSDLCTVDVCDGSGSCMFDENIVCADPTTCDGGSTCNPSTGTCVDDPDAPVGTSCDLDSNACTVDECDGAGTCVFNEDVICADPTTCDGGSTCNPATGACVDDPDAPAGTSCNRDGDLCTLDICDGSGSCVFDDNVSCPGATACDGGQSCNPATGTCEDLADPAAGTACDLDSNACTVDECDGLGDCIYMEDVTCPAATTCDGGAICDSITGACVDQPDEPAGTTCDRDGDACTIDACDGAGSCVFVENVVCDDPTTCDAGQVCNPTSGVCDDLPDPAAGTACDLDSNQCTTDQCDGLGACVYVEDVSCPASTGPCDGGFACDMATGDCIELADAIAGTTCERDGDLCTIDGCDGFGSCVLISNVTCDGPTGTCDAGQTCNSGTGTCEDLPDPAAGTACDLDANQCTTDQCDGLGACVFVEDVTCPGPTGTCDGGTTCNTVTGACDDLPDPVAGTACERDGDLCTIDQCDGAGTCVYFNDVTCSGPLNSCDGGTVCNSTTGACDDLPDTAAGTACNEDSDRCTVDYCDGGGNCVFDSDISCPGPVGQCDAGTACNPATGACDDLPDPALGTTCERDGDLCTIDECDGSGSCIYDGPVSCPSPISSCDGGAVCNPSTGVCDHLPDIPEGVMCADDGDPCTVQVCDDTGDCVLLFERCGACCRADGTCERVSHLSCAAHGDHWRGRGVSCAGDSDGDGIDDGCPAAPPEPLTTVSSWGLAMLMLLLAVGLAIRFARRVKA